MAEQMPMPAAVWHARMQLLDYLRFIAAAAVVGFHYLFNGIANGKIATLSHEPALVDVAKYGYLGVDLFFLISGFVVTISARGKTARQFVVGRAVRLYPAFWLAMLFTAAMTALFGGQLLQVTFPQVLVNLTMFPSVLGVPSVDGVYWTLIYELEFYLVIFVVLLAGWGRWLNTIFVAWTLVMVAATFAVPLVSELVPYLGGYFLLFGCGAVIAGIRDFGWSLPRVVALVAGYVAAIRFETGFVGTMIEAKGVHFSAPVVAGIVTGFFVALLAMCNAGVASWELPGSRKLGALTYPLYLIHAHFGYMMLTRFATEETKWLAYGLLVMVVLALSWAIHEVAEVRSKRFWYRFFDRTVGRPVGHLQPHLELVGLRRK